ncbi:MAG: intradiol ring-cleavage dioxygenase [Burkholderiaceae bacterium]|nr:intradiol ring-cleavage dioxygenase [Burkholderiaceae bacterium]
MTPSLPRPAHPSHPEGLQHDLPQLAALAALAQRRRALGWLGSLALPLAACGGGGDAAGSSSASSGGSGSSGSGSTTSGSCSTIPSETAGPYPGDGSNTSNGATSNALGLASIVRSDITSSIDGASGTAAGVPLTITLTLVDSSSSCTPLAGRAVYLWHCTRDGLYSLYSSGVTNQNYLRGVQVSDANGQLSFRTIVPGCYSGRWPHVHFEVFASLASATRGANALKTSQLAMPQAVCQTVYNQASGYSASVANLAAITLAGDNVFGEDSAALQMASVSGSLAEGYVASLTVGLSG